MFRPRDNSTSSALVGGASYHIMNGNLAGSPGHAFPAVYARLGGVRRSPVGSRDEAQSPAIWRGFPAIPLLRSRTLPRGKKRQIVRSRLDLRGFLL